MMPLKLLLMSAGRSATVSGIARAPSKYMQTLLSRAVPPAEQPAWHILSMHIMKLELFTLIEIGK